MNGASARLHVVLAVALAALTVIVYAPVRDFQFVNYDDNVYVTDNARVASGVSPGNIAWSLTAFVNGNWHPATLLSHMADVQMFGRNPSGHHTTNLALHVGNVLLLFWLLAGTTKQAWPAACVAALFAVHPLNVQTVAWISERKSLLSTAFWLMALLAHAAYRRRPNGPRYLLVVVLAVLALAAKPMAVTLPLTIVLLDYWPLAVLSAGSRSSWRRSGRELAPLLVVSGVCGVLTLMAQHAVHAIQSVEVFPLPVRLGNAVVSYAWYLKAMVWPVGLAVFYPHPMAARGVAVIAVSFVVLAACCAAAVAARRALPAVSMGWWWYAGTLLPVAGLIQVGAQAYADRYAYVPLIGIFILVCWSVLRWTRTKPLVWRRASAVAGVVWIAGLSLVTRAQLPYWHDSVSLFRRAIDVVPDNALAQNNLGMALVEQHRIAEALQHFEKAVAIAPHDTDARSNLGNALRALGRPAEAAVRYEQALEQAPDDASIHYNLATSLVDLGRVDEAITHLEAAVELNPDYTKARFLLGGLRYRQGRTEEALAQFREVARLDPRDAKAAAWVSRIERERANGAPR